MNGAGEPKEIRMRTSSRAKIGQPQATRDIFDTNDAALEELTDEGPSQFKMLVLALEISLLSNSLGGSIVLNYSGRSKLRKAERRQSSGRRGSDGGGVVCGCRTGCIRREPCWHSGQTWGRGGRFRFDRTAHASCCRWL